MAIHMSGHRKVFEDAGLCRIQARAFRAGTITACAIILSAAVLVPWELVSAQVQETNSDILLPTAAEHVKCPQYKVFYIDPATQFFTPPVPIEDHAEFVFCSDHKMLDELRARLKTMKPVGSRADISTGRIKVVPRGRPDEAIIFCSSGELTFRGKQYRLNRQFFEPALASIRAESDKRRAMAVEQENARMTDDQAARHKPPSTRSPAKAR